MPIHVSARLGYPGAQIPGGPPASNLVRYGISSGSNVNSSITLVDAKIVRCYSDSWPTSWAATGSAHNVNAAIPICYSAKSGPTIANPNDNNANDFNIYGASGMDTTFRDNMRATLKGAPKLGIPQYFSWHHEPYGDGTLTAAQWVQGHKNLANEVLVNVNNARGNADRWILNPVMNGFPVAQNAFDSYFPTSLYTYCAGIGVEVLAGIDCYGYLKTNGTVDTSQAPPNDQFHKAHDWAKGRGVAWSVPEIGAMVGGAATDTTSDQELTQMQNMQNNLSGANAWPASERPVFVAWFNGNSSTITSKASASAFWKNLCDTGAGN